MSIIFLLGVAPVFSADLRLEIPQPYDLGKFCAYTLLPNAAANVEEVLTLPTAQWKPIHSSVISLGVNPSIVWLRCRLVNQSVEQNWSLVSQYNFGRSIEAFFVTGREKMPQAAQLQPNTKSFWQRNDAFALPTKSAQPIEIVLRYESDLAKVMYFQVMPERLLTGQENQESAFFLVFTAVLILFILLNLLLAVSLKSVIPVLYSLSMLTYYLYQIIQLGFGPVLFYPDRPAINGNMVSISAGISIIFYQLFFQRLLQFKTLVPRLNLVMNVISVVSGVYIFATAFTLLPIGILQKIGRLLFFTAAMVVFSAGWIVYRKRFRPAIYSIYGYAVILLCQSFYFAVMSGFIDFGGYFVKIILPLGQTVEYLFFFTTLSLRLRDKAQINRLRQITEDEEITRDLQTDEKLRLSEDKAAKVSDELREIFTREKIFCDEDLSLDRLSAMLHITRHELSDLLSKRFGTNFYDFINRYRVEEAQRLLRENPEEKILDIAMAVGFNSKSTFNKEFKRVTGKTPKATRNPS